MSETTPHSELAGIRRALIDWFQSQEIEPVAASFVCAQLAGVLAAELAEWRGLPLPNGLKILERTMRKSASQTVRQIRKEKNR